MSFGKLFATGKNLMGGKSESRYQVRNRAFLPTFISPKNPFAPAPNKDGAVEQAASPATSATSQSPKAADSVARTSVLRRAASLLAMLIEKLNPRSWMGRRSQPRKSVIPVFSRKPEEGMQGELHLENVRVVRNDLSDADLEVVRVGAGGNKNVPTGTAWGHLVSRIFGPGQGD